MLQANGHRSLVLLISHGKAAPRIGAGGLVWVAGAGLLAGRWFFPAGRFCVCAGCPLGVPRLRVRYLGMHMDVLLHLHELTVAAVALSACSSPLIPHSTA